MRERGASRAARYVDCNAAIDSSPAGNLPSVSRDASHFLSANFASSVASHSHAARRKPQVPLLHLYESTRRDQASEYVDRDEL